MIKKLERTFDLINNKGEAYTLSMTGTHTGFFYDVEGLGSEHSITYEKIGNQFDILEDDINQGSIGGVIWFRSKYPYQEYARFVQFCEESPLIMRYLTPVGEYFRQGNITKIEKNEGGEDARAKIIFTASSLWYRKVKETASGSVTVKSDSLNESPCCLSFTGVTVSNGTLSWSQKVDNVTKMSGSLTGVTISSTDRVYIRTDGNPYQIYKVSSGGTKTDLYAKSNFTTARFPFLYKGTNQFIVTGATITIEGKILYETV